MWLWGKEERGEPYTAERVADNKDEANTSTAGAARGFGALVEGGERDAVLFERVRETPGIVQLQARREQQPDLLRQRPCQQARGIRDPKPGQRRRRE